MEVLAIIGTALLSPGANLKPDELLDIFRSGIALSERISESIVESVDSWKQFMSSVSAFQHQVLHDWREHSLESKGVFHQVITDIQSTISSLLGGLHTQASETSSALNGLLQVCKP